MAIRFDVYHRLEPDETRDLDRGIAAEVADPLWFLTRQWQMGEHQGEDAASPVSVRYECRRVPLSLPARPEVDLAAIPVEALLEAEPDQWWTPGRRVLIGRAVMAAAEVAGIILPEDSSLFLSDLPLGYERLNGEPDGLALYRRQVELGLEPSWFPVIPPHSSLLESWHPEEMHYSAEIDAEEATLSVSRHDGGRLGWYSFASDRRPSGGRLSAAELYPGRLRYPGAPDPRWWTLENSARDIGGFAPDRSHFATLLLIELLTTHSDDWFTFPIDVDTGTVVLLDHIDVTDVFGDTHRITHPTDGWSIYDIAGLGSGALVITPVIPVELEGLPLEEIDLGIHEDANLAWAMERRTRGLAFQPQDHEEPVRSGGTLDATAELSYRYELSPPPPARWHPYVLRNFDEGGESLRRFVQARLADFSQDEFALTDPPIARLLRDPNHRIDPNAIPTRGLRLERRYRLARDTDGQPVLWLQRSAQPRGDTVSLQFRHDLLNLVPTTE